jgi:CYTH domain-containing protein
MPRPVEIVLTGGPCSGKTSSLAVISQKLADWGFRPLMVPEIPTILIGGGIPDIGTIAADPDRFRVLESHFLAFQRAIRQRYLAMAAECFPDERVVIVYDRGERDVAAYMAPDAWRRILYDAGLSEADVRDSYDAVIHLVSAAKGAESFYTTANNTARRETVEEARAQDDRTLAAWVGHPHLRIIGNETDFEAKMRRVMAAVARVLGVPEPVEIERKFLVEAPSPAVLAALGATAVEIEQHYLEVSPEREVRIRRRGAGRHAMYYRTEKARRSAAVRVETEAAISRHEYDRLLPAALPDRRPIRKVRHCFAAGGAYWELDEFTSHPGLWLLEVELGDEGDEVRLPDGLSVIREVTGDPGFSNASLALAAS